MPNRLPQQLAERERLFVQAYVKNFNGCEAVVAAGYSPGPGARIQAGRLLARASVQSLIAKRVESLVEKHNLSADKIVAELTKIGFANMADYTRLTSGGDRVIDLSAVTRDQLAAVTEIVVEDYADGRGEDAREVRRTKLKLHDKKGALVDLLKYVTGQKLSGDTFVQVNQTVNHLSMNVTQDEAAKVYDQLISTTR
jgi:phage terminase small subunit